MVGSEAFRVEGAVVETLSNGTFRVELSNGHKVLAFVTGKAKRSFAAVPGEKVTLQMSPYDLSQGRIVVETKTI